MKILLTGGTGFIGHPLRKELVSSGHELFILTRLRKEDTENVKYINWNYLNPTDITDLINQADLVINLAGEGVAKKKWTKEQKEILYKSRIETTKLIVTAINNSMSKPKKLISASAIGIYGNRLNEELKESSSLGSDESDFLVRVCKEWEACALCAKTNVVILRIGLVLGKEGGALQKILPPFKMFLGGPFGSGNQWVSWISLHDVVGLVKFAATNDNVTGTLNVTSPNPVTNKEFSNILGKALHRPSLMRIPRFALRLLLGEMSSLLLSSQKVVPQRALEYTYKFKYPSCEGALLASI